MTRILCASACLLLGLAGPARANAPIRVVALSPVLAEIAADVGGPAAEVSSLLPPGVDPHTFEPAPADLRVVRRRRPRPGLGPRPRELPRQARRQFRDPAPGSSRPATPCGMS